VAWCVGFFFLPVVYSVAYVWLRADASIAWGETGSVRGLLDHVSGGMYHDMVERSPQALLREMPETVRRTLRQLPPPAWLLLFPGALVLAQTRPPFAMVLGTWTLLLMLFISGYHVAGREDYLQGTTMVLSLVAAWGAVATGGWIASRLPARGARAGVAVVVVGLFAWWAVWVGMLSRSEATHRSSMKQGRPCCHFPSTRESTRSATVRRSRSGTSPRSSRSVPT
jgi:hypothetical protein